MKVKAYEVIEAMPHLQELGNSKMGGNAMLKVAILLKKVSDVFKVIEESRSRIIAENSKRDNEGNVITGKNEEGEDMPGTVRLTPEGAEKHKELLHSWVDIDVEPIHYSELAGATAKPSLLVALSSFIILDD